MTNTYKILFDLQVTHTYFEGGFCEGLVYQASKATQKLIEKYTFKFFITNKGFQFYSTQKQSKEKFLNYITRATGTSYFEFSAYPLDQVFYQYTDFPTEEIGELLYDSSRSDFKNGFEVLKKKIQQERVANNLFKLRIYFDDLIGFKEENNSIHFKIDFFSRATKWQYNIINNSKQQFNELAIKGNPIVSFDSGKEVTLENGQKATCFTSTKEELYFSQVSKYRFDLVNIKEKFESKKEKIIFKGLPMPNPKQLKIINENTQKSLLSPMYVYI